MKICFQHSLIFLKTPQQKRNGFIRYELWLHKNGFTADTKKILLKSNTQYRSQSREMSKSNFQFLDNIDENRFQNQKTYFNNLENDADSRVGFNK